MTIEDPPRDRVRPRVVVVGPCASGKTTLVTNLAAIGVDARVCGQEHSAIVDLWKKMDPDILIALNLDLATLRSRRGPAWPEALFNVQQGRLAGAFQAADAVIDTTITSEVDALAKTLQVVAEHDPN